METRITSTVSVPLISRWGPTELEKIFEIMIYMKMSLEPVIRALQ